MSGAWAKAADARKVLPHCGLEHAAAELALTWAQQQQPDAQRNTVIRASAIIRRERKRLPDSERVSGWWLHSESDEGLLWAAIRYVASVCLFPDPYKAVKLREAEAALRIWWKRNGQ